MLCQIALDGIDPGLGALLILVGRAAADANPTDLHTLFAVMIGRPPANVTMPGKLAMPGTMPGLPSLPKASSPNLRVEKGKLAEVTALC
jgi:hypothetical protein